MANQIIIKNSGNVSAVPSSLAYGELAINYADGNLFYQNSSNVVTVIASNKAISLSGNVTSGNVNTGNVSLLGNILSNVNTTFNITTTATTSTNNLNATGVVDFGTSSNIWLGSNANVHITGGIAGQQLATDGSGNLYWTDGGSLSNGTSNITLYQNGNITMTVGGVANVAVFTTTGVVVPGNVSAGNLLTDNIYYANGQPWDMQQPAGSNTQIQYNNNGNFGADANLTFDSANAVFGTANITASGTISGTGTITGGNLATGGTASATGNITGGNVLTGGIVSATANITGGNLLTGGTASATGNITGGNVLTGGQVSATANITGGNVLTGGIVSATGNITGGNISTTGSGGNITGANVISGTTLSATANVVGGNITTAGTVSATANITGGNVLTGGQVSATANITGGNLLTGGQVSATANITGGNVLTGGQVSATGNITGGNIISGNAVIGNISVTGDVTVNSITSNTYVSAVANVVGGNVLTGGRVSATGNITGGNILSGGQISTSGTVTGANITGGNVLGTYISSSGNVDAFSTLNGLSLSLSGNVISPLNVTGDITANNISGVNTISATGNITGGNLLTGGAVSAGGNVTGANIYTGGQVTAAGNIIVQSGSFYIGNGSQLTGVVASSVDANNLTGNTLASSVVNSSLTSVGSLTTLSVVGTATVGNVNTGGAVSATGNVTGGNILTGGYVSATGNVTGGNVNTNNLVGTALTVTSTGNLNLQPTGNVVLANTYINGVAYPAQDQDAASKLYVDNMAATGLAYHEAVYVATTDTLANITGGTITYAQPNGAANGVGATLTTTGSFNLIDSANVQTAGIRILVKNQANAVQNGVYVWSNATVITRSTDADEYGPNSAEQLSVNDYFFVTSGNINLGSAWVVDSPTGTITFGTSNIQFAQFSQSQVYSANTNAGLSLIGQQFNAKVDNNTTAFDGGGNIIVKANANLTTPNIGAATGTSLSVTGTVTGGDVNTGGNVSAGGNVIGGNVSTGGFVTATGNVTGGNVLTGGIVSATGNITGNYFIGNGSQLTGVTATSAGFPITAGSSNIAGVTNGNISITVAGTPNVAVFASTGQYVDGLLSVTGNVRAGNIVVPGGNIDVVNFVNVGALIATGRVDAGTTMSAAGNITGANLLTGGLISATSNITGGNISTAGLANVATLTVTTFANVTATTISTSNVTGALRVAGGVGVTGNVYADDMYSGGFAVLNANSVIDGGTF